MTHNLLEYQPIKRDGCMYDHLIIGISQLAVKLKKYMASSGKHFQAVCS